MPRVNISTIATFPPGFFLENIVALRDDTLLVTVANRKCVYAVPPSSTPDHLRTPYLLHQFDDDQWAFGIVAAPDNPSIVYVLTTDFTSQGSCTHNLCLLDIADVAAACHPKVLARFPAEAQGLNGLAAISPDVLLAADSFAGCIWRIDLTRDSPGISPTAAKIVKWVSDPAFDGKLVLPDFQPGVNGLKYSHALGRVCFSSTQQRLFGTVDVDPETLDAVGPVQILLRGPQGDDLFVDDSFKDGPVAYLTTHRDNSIIRIPLSAGANQSPEAIAEATGAQPLVLGPTSGAWKSGMEGRTAYVNCDGGLKKPRPGEAPQYARILRVDMD